MAAASASDSSDELPPGATFPNLPAQSRHVVLCGGRVVVGPDIGVTMFAFGLIAGACAAFYALVAPHTHGALVAIHVALFAVVTVNLVRAATTDPGIIPPCEDMDDAEAEACAAEYRTVVIRGVEVPLKWCYTCRIYRPPRTVHCAECNACVANGDHHCPWMGQCVGERNYRY